MMDYFGEFLSPGLGNIPMPPPSPPRGLGEESGGLSWKHKILWPLSLAGVGYIAWKASKVHTKLAPVIAKTKNKLQKKLKRRQRLVRAND